jgi:soluble lytic murein transglycosylase-like protein
MTVPISAAPNTTTRAATPRTTGPTKPGLRPPGTRPVPARNQSQNAFSQALSQAQGSRTLGATSAAPASAARASSGLMPSGLISTQPIDLSALGVQMSQTAPVSQAAPAPVAVPAAPAAIELPGGFGLMVADAAKRYGVDPALVAAVMETESRFNPDAVSRAGAQGLMQLMPGTARGLGVTDASDPLQNILGGTKLLGQLTEKYGNNLEHAIAAYNAGSGAVDKYGGIPPYGETQKYVPLVLSAYERFKTQFGGPTAAPTPAVTGTPAGSVGSVAQAAPTGRR